MKLWLLRPVTGDEEQGPWNPWYDKAFGFVVRAETEADARAIAQRDGGDEVSSAHPAWTSAEFSTCEELTADGEAGMVIRDFHAA